MPGREPSRSVSGVDGRKIGVAVAVVVAIGVLGVFALLALRSQTPAGGQQRTDRADVTLPQEALTMESTTVDVLTTPIESLRGSTEGRIELFDEKSGELRQTLAYTRFEPLESGRFAVTDPRATILLDDGGAIEVLAKNARFVRRGTSNEPQSGEFRGDVRIRLLDAESHASGVPGEGLLVRTESLRFDATLGELRTNDEVRADSDEVSFVGKGLTIVFNERDRTLQYLRVDQGESLAWTGRSASREGSGASDDRPARERRPGPGRENRYRAQVTGPISIESDGRRMDAERLDIWLAMLDGRLAPDALADIAFASDDAENDGGVSPARDPARDASGRAVTMRWSGPLEIQPIERDAPELASDRVFARFSSPQRGLVRVSDLASGFEASGVSFDYGATTGRFTISGVGPRGVTVRAPTRGEAVGGRFEADLVAGTASFPGPGTLRALGESLDPRAVDASGQALARDASWRGGAAFTLARNAAGALLPGLRDATLREGVLVRDPAGQATADSVRVEFAHADGRSHPTRVLLRDNATIDAREEGIISASTIDLALDRVAGSQRVDIRSATSQGGVRAARRDATVRGELVEARFVTDAQGRAEVDSFRADERVEITLGEGDERVFASGRSVRAEPRNNRAELIGVPDAPASLRRGPATLSGQAIRLLGDRNAIEAFGEGEATYDLAVAPAQDRPGSLPYERVTMRWSNAMSYDDSTGRAEFAGDALLRADAGAHLRDTARAERIVAILAPGTPGDNYRRLASATLYSAMYEGVSDSPAEIESRRYETGATGEGALSQLVYLSGEEIRVDGVAETLLVPGAGRLLVEDRRASGQTSAAAPGTPGAPIAGSSSRGTTLFEWDGSLRAQRAAGDATIDRNVRVRHLPLNDAHTVELECERLVAIAREQSPGAGVEDGRLTVDRIEASGAVYAKNRRKQMLADRLIFDPVRNILEAHPALNNVITLFDPSAGAPLIARDPVFWDIANDRVRASGLETISTPR